METAADIDMLQTMGQVAPGTPLREGLDRVLEARRGGLIVISDNEPVLSICSGGFMVDTPFSPQKLGELSKMDGAIILDSAVSRIVRANVHLLPDPKIQTAETGTRHRTAERVARSLDVPVVAVSESRQTIQVYLSNLVRPILSASRLLEKANQAVQTLERYRSRLDIRSRHLSMLEIEDLVSVRDVIEMVQTAEMVSRISDEIKRTLVELGSDGRLVRFQLEDILHGVADERRLLLRDYLPAGTADLNSAMQHIGSLSEDELYSDKQLAEGLALIAQGGDMDELVTPRGYRILSRLPRINEESVNVLVESFESLSAIIRADVAEISAIEGFSAELAGALKDGTMRLVENSFFDRL